jgi:hypothetical protein
LLLVVRWTRRHRSALVLFIRGIAAIEADALVATDDLTKASIAGGRQSIALPPCAKRSWPISPSVL